MVKRALGRYSRSPNAAAVVGIVSAFPPESLEKTGCCESVNYAASCG